MREVVTMKNFNETVTDRAKHDPEFQNGLVAEALASLERGELDVAKILLRDYINSHIKE